jgi:hypothetical protein
MSTVSHLTLQATVPAAIDLPDPGVTQALPDLETVRLVRLAREGDRDAFSGLVDRHQQSAWRVAMAALGRPEDADDAAQDAFLSAWRTIQENSTEELYNHSLMSIMWT